MSGPSVSPDKWMDFIKAPLNPCSIETLPEPVVLSNGSLIWPVMMACYQLEGNENEQQQRVGQLNLYKVQVPDVSSNKPTLPLSFGEPDIIMYPPQSAHTNGKPQQETTGILDGKWAPMPSRSDCKEKSWAFATAHSSGEIRVHGFHVPDKDDEVDFPPLDSDPLYNITQLGSSQETAKLENGAGDDDALCLSLNWDAHPENKGGDPLQTNRIVSSYSNGTVAIHDIVYLNGTASVIESDSWQAHSMFSSPAEVWSVCFSDKCFDSKAVISCGDDGSCKVWDIRATNRPAQVLKHFDAGITCVAPHPRHDHLLAVGSYDETLCIYDTRYFRPLCRTPKIGGGIWRIKWHPYTNRRLLVAAMHGGAQAINVKGFESYLSESNGYVLLRTDRLLMILPFTVKTNRLIVFVYHRGHFDDIEYPINTKSSPLRGPFPALSPSSSSLSSSANMHCKVTKEFQEHESMCYGADWLVYRHPKHDDSYFEAAVSCSFYDKSTYLWDSVF